MNINFMQSKIKENGIPILYFIITKKGYKICASVYPSAQEFRQNNALCFNFDACPVHSSLEFMHFTHQSLSVCAMICLDSLAKVNTQLLIYNLCLDPVQNLIYFQIIP